MESETRSTFVQNARYASEIKTQYLNLFVMINSYPKKNTAIKYHGFKFYELLTCDYMR